MHAPMLRRRAIVATAVAGLASRSLLASGGAGGEGNRVRGQKGQAILQAGNEATRTLKAIMAATKVKACPGFQVDSRGRTNLPSINLKGQGLTDLSPFELLHFADGEIDLSNNNVSDVRPLTNSGASRL